MTESVSKEILAHERMKEAYKKCSEYSLTDTLSESYINGLRDYFRYYLGQQGQPFQKIVFFAMTFVKQYVLEDLARFDQTKLQKLVTDVGEKAAAIYLASAALHKVEEQQKRGYYP